MKFQSGNGYPYPLRVIHSSIQRIHYTYTYIQQVTVVGEKKRELGTKKR